MTDQSMVRGGVSLSVFRIPASPTVFISEPVVSVTHCQHRPVLYNSPQLKNAFRIHCGEDLAVGLATQEPEEGGDPGGGSILVMESRCEEQQRTKTLKNQGGEGKGRQGGRRSLPVQGVRGPSTKASVGA